MNDEIIKLCQEKIAQGSTQDEIIVFLHTQEATFDDATVIFRNLFGNSVGEIYSLFQNHSVWQKDVETSIELTQAFFEDYNDEKDSLL